MDRDRSNAAASIARLLLQLVIILQQQARPSLGLIEADLIRDVANAMGMWRPAVSCSMDRFVVG